MKGIQSCPTLCDPMDYIVRGILQARILEWVTFPFLQEIFPTQGSDPSLPRCRWILYQLNTKDAPGSIPGLGRSPGEGNSNPLQCSCLENPRDRGAQRAAIYGVAQSRTQLKRRSSSSKVLNINRDTMGQNSLIYPKHKDNILTFSL